MLYLTKIEALYQKKIMNVHRNSFNKSFHILKRNVFFSINLCHGNEIYNIKQAIRRNNFNII